MTQPKNLKIAIVGAGAAGYFAAAALKRNCANVDVTVIYDPDTPYIGVGESLVGMVQLFSLSIWDCTMILFG